MRQSRSVSQEPHLPRTKRQGRPLRNGSKTVYAVCVGASLGLPSITFPVWEFTTDGLATVVKRQRALVFDPPADYDCHIDVAHIALELGALYGVFAVGVGVVLILRSIRRRALE